MKIINDRKKRKILIIPVLGIIVLASIISFVSAAMAQNSLKAEVDAITAATSHYYQDQNFDWEKALENINVPETIIDDLKVKAAFSDDEIFFWFQYDSGSEGIFDDYAYYSDGKWTIKEHQPWGTQDVGLNEDRIALLIDDGNVPEFKVAGYYALIHDGAPYLYNTTEESLSEKFKYLPATRSDNDQNEIIPNDQLLQKHQKGYFLDLWQWGAHRTAPTGSADNLYIMERQHTATGDAPYVSNWDKDNERPRWIFNPQITGYYSLKWSDIEEKNLTGNDYYYLSEEIAIEWSNIYSPQEGDVIPVNLLRQPTGNRSSVQTDSNWQNGKRTVVFRRSLDTGYPMEDKIFNAGEVYTIVAAVHRNATSDRWNMITKPFTVGLETEADVTAIYIQNEDVKWQNIESVNMRIFYPAQVTWQFLNDPAHLGFAGMDTDGEIGGVELSSYHSVEQFAGFVVGNEFRILEAALLAQEGSQNIDKRPGLVFYILLGITIIILAIIVISLSLTYSSRQS